MRPSCFARIKTHALLTVRVRESDPSGQTPFAVSPDLRRSFAAGRLGSYHRGDVVTLPSLRVTIAPRVRLLETALMIIAGALALAAGTMVLPSSAEAQSRTIRCPY